MPLSSSSRPATPPGPPGLHPLHRLWRWLPAGPRRALLAYGGARLAPRKAATPLPPQGGLAVAGEVTQASGLGEGARVLHAALATLGVPSWLMAAGLSVPGARQDDAAPARGAAAQGALGQVGLAPAGLASDGREPGGAEQSGAGPGWAMIPRAAPLVVCVNAPQLGAALLRMPRAMLLGRRMIGYWSWELPVLPDTWRPALAMVHEVWVPSAFTAAAVRAILPRDGAPLLRVVPHPLAAAPPVPAQMDRAAFGLPQGAVVVLASFNLASSFARKNPLGMIAAFRAAFAGRADRMLVLKIGKPEHYADDLAAIRAAAEGAANIRIETRNFAPAERHALTACSDIVLSLHRSEGFGLVPAEAMLLGRPVVATGWSGNMTFMDADSAALVAFRLVQARDPRGVYAVPGAMWAEPDIADAAARLAHLAEHPAARAELGARGYAAACARLGTEALADAVAALGLAPHRGEMP